MTKLFRLSALVLAGTITVASAQEKAPPQMSVGVVQCGEVVALWVVLQDGKVYRTDAEHHPDTAQEYNAFLKWAAQGQQDLYTLPCPDQAKGGKPKAKAKS